MCTNYVLSPYLRIVKRGEEFAVYNTLRSGSLIFLDEKALNFLLEFKSGKQIEEGRQVLSEEERDAFEIFIQNDYIQSLGLDLRLQLKTEAQAYRKRVRDGLELRGMVLEVTKHCNFGCKYCFSEQLSKKGSRQADTHMKSDVARSAIDSLFTNAKRADIGNLEVSFLGGEPLLNWRLVREATEYVCELSKENDIGVSFGITTNASAVDTKIAQYLFIKKFRISVSVDGLGSVNDAVRTMRNGKGTFSRIAKGLELLLSSGNDVTVLTTITDKNLNLINDDFVSWLAVAGVRNWGINLEDLAGDLTSDSIKVSEKIKELVLLADRHGVQAGGMWFKPVHAMVNKNTAYCSSASGNFLSVEPDGSVYACSKTNQRYGHVSDLRGIFENLNYLESATRVAGSLPGCSGCNLEGHCMGSCMAVGQVTHESMTGCNTCSLVGKNKVACDFSRKLSEEILSSPEIPLFG